MALSMLMGEKRKKCFEIKDDFHLTSVLSDMLAPH